MAGEHYSGQKLSGNISASLMNRMRAHLERTEAPSGFTVPQGETPAAVDGIGLVVNKTQHTFAPGEIVGLDAPLIKPDGNFDEFKNSLQFSAAMPTADHVGRFGIALQGIPPEAAGPVQISGLAYVRVRVTNLNYLYADVIPDEKAGLETKPVGSAQILYKFTIGETTPQIAPCYVRMGNTPGEAGSTRIYGTLGSALASTDASFSTSSYTVSSQGAQFPSGSITIYNPLNLQGDSSAPWKAEYNDGTSHWELYAIKNPIPVWPTSGLQVIGRDGSTWEWQETAECDEE